MLTYILIAIIWVLYGIIASHQDKSTEDSDYDVIFTKWLVTIVLSPIIFIARAIEGAFRERH